MKIKFFLLAVFLSFASFYTYGMEDNSQTCQLKTSQKPDKQMAIVDLESIKPIQLAPFDFIPQYLYENPNQVTKHKWSFTNFQKLKKAVPTITQKQLKQKFPEPEAYKKAAEGYDWIYGLLLLEAEYLNKPIDGIGIQTLKLINGALSRFTRDLSGEFRKVLVSWKTKLLNPAEQVFYSFLNSQIDYIKKNQTILEYNLFKKSISIISIIALLKHYNENRYLCPDINGEIDCSEPLKWGQAGDKQTAINLEQWINARTFLFPDPEIIEEYVVQMLAVIQLSAAHPIWKAAYIWYSIVKIHPWREANKRTGRALGSLILLQHGYLPPLITKEEEQEYVKLFIDGFADEDDGLNNFVQFIARQIIKTQEKCGAHVVQST